jgi:DNA repair protein RecN (Recombination protein N)
MLKDLHVKNFAIIEDLDIQFGEGLNILTGETGAGKSIIIGALGILLGQRAYTEMIMTGKEQATVQAFFDIKNHPITNDMGIDTSEGIILRRSISRAGKTKAYINDTMVNLQSLSRLGDSLVDAHGQHEHQSIRSLDKQMSLLDQYGSLKDARAEISSAFSELTKLRTRLEDLQLGSRERAQKTDMLQFQVDEINSAGLIPGEDVKLEEELEILSNLTRLKELVEGAYSLLNDEDGSSIEKLSNSINSLKEMAEIDSEAYAPLELLEQALPLAEDAAFVLRDLRERYDLDPAKLDEVQERLRVLDNMKKKYGDSIDEVISFKDSAAAELEDLEGAEENTEVLEVEIAQKEEILLSKAQKLSKKRAQAATSIEKEVIKVLVGLAFAKAEFKVNMETVQLSSSGIDKIEFLFSANKGEDPKSLTRVASGGELSRIMLAIKTVLRKADDIPVLVFDEVDAGIGGKTANNVAERLKESSEGRQVLCVTHLPQIASIADKHFLIEKFPSRGRTSVTLQEISGEKRQEEIARMLSGTVTDTSLEHARELIDKA